MATVSLSGVFSGIDTDLLISHTMTAKRRPVVQLEMRKGDWEAKLAAVGDVEERLTTFKGVVASLRDAGAMQLSRASSSDTDVLSATATSGAAEGAHLIVVNRLAAAERQVHSGGVATMETAVSAGDFVYSYDGVTRTITTTATTTLAEFRDLINNDGTNPGVTASAFEYNGAYHLVLAGEDSGGDYDIVITGATTLVGFGAADFTESQDAVDSQIRVDGFPAAAWIERSTNAIGDVIGGVTLNLKAAGTVTVTVSRNTAGLTKALDNLVSVYNGLVESVGGYIGYDAETETRGVLQGDGTMRGILDNIRNSLVVAPKGFAEGEDPYYLPVQIGLMLDRYGELSILQTTTDTDTSLADALAADYLGVLSMIGAKGTGISDDSYIQFMGTSDATEAGFYDVEVGFNGATVDWAQIEIRTDPDDPVAPLRFMDVSGSTLTGVAGNAEEGLQLSAITDGTPGVHTQTAVVRVRQGFAGAIYDNLDDMLEEISGTIQTKKDQLSATIKNIDNRIEEQVKRLETYEEWLRQKYARMEATLAQLEAMNSAFQGLLMSLNTGGSGDD